ncbi:uncharacterized protein LOC119730772 [Patiria miniata]|uniref:G-protein coupled receptors family 3 profile domain-containing protein n=1 Tax=Patiria miniata TaxID=46514 RepID=A0A914A7G3_PATMI|nr:uncharacterized protein LOC119730772 [Patiria miniata]
MAPHHVIAILLVSMVTVMPISSQQCPVIQGYTPIVTKPGADLTLGLMLSLHEASQDTTSGALCNFSAETGYGSLSMKAAVAATDNWPDSIQLPGLSVGLEIYDLCETFQLGEYSTVRFANERYNDIFANGTVCTNKTLRLGVVGFRYNSWSEPLSALLQPLDIPVISFTSTSNSLSDSEKYPNFFRIVPPDNAAVKALVTIMKSYNWTYSAIVHGDDSYGMSGLQAVTESIKEAGFCLTEPISVGAGETSDSAYDAIVNHLIQRNFTVVILWALPENIHGLFLAVERIQGAAYDITWLSGDAPLYVDFATIPGNARAARSLFTLSPFVDTNAMYKTWLAQWYPNTVFNYSPTGQLIDVIHAYMSAFSLAHQDKCGGQQGMCEALANIQGSEFIDYIRQVNFTGIEGRAISFSDENADPANQFYEVLQFKSTGTPNTYSFQKVGEWTTDQGLTLNNDQVEFYGQGDTPVGPPTSVCTEGSCFDPRCQEITNFVIENLFGIYLDGCTVFSFSGYTEWEAVFYAVHQINEDPNLLPYVHLSLTANQICGDLKGIGKASLDLIQRWNFDGGFPAQDDTHLLGVLHNAFSASAIVTSTNLQIADVPVIDNTASTPLLSNKDEYGNFLRTNPSDLGQAAAIVDLMSSLGWTYVQTINTKGTYGDGAIEAMKELTDQAGICIANSFRVDDETDYAQLARDLLAKPKAKTIVVILNTAHARSLFQQLIAMNVSAGRFQFIGSDVWGTRMDYIPGSEGPAKGALTVNFKSTRVPEFEDYFLSQTPDTAYNPYFKDFWMRTFECNLPGQRPLFSRNCTGSEMLSRSEISSIGTEYFINSVYVYAIALSKLINDTCPNGKICDAVFDVSREEWQERLKAVNFVSHVGLRRRVSFDENGDGPASYSLSQFTETDGTYQYNEVGSWTSDEGLDLNTDMLKFYGPDGPIVGVPSSSSYWLGFCSDPVCHDADHRTEFVIEGLFDLHGSQCDALRENRFTQVEAARFAVREINCNASFLTGVRMSLTMNDICGDTTAAKMEALRSIQGWGFGGGFPNQEDESYLMGVLHSGSSSKAIEESKVLQIPDVPLMANSATSPALSDKSMFGNFLRTVPSDTKQAAAMADLLARLGLTYIQTIHTKGAYGEGGIQALKEVAKEKGICIANSFVVVSTTTTNFARILNDILGKPDARTLVLFLTDEHAQALFEVMVDKNIDPGQFQILASDTWGTRTDYIPGFESQAIGALTVFSKTSVIPEFEDYFLQLTPETQDGTNPYFNEYWMQKFQCDLPGHDEYRKTCTGSERLSRSDVNSLGMENIINVIQAYAVALSDLIGETCPDGGPCDALYDLTSQHWFDYLKDVAFISPVGSRKMVSFDENGDGAALYSIYQLTEMNNMFQYQEIGSWDDVDGLSSLSDDIIDPMFSSVCTGLCLECNPPTSPDANTTSHQDYFSIPGDLDFPVVMQLSKSGDGVTCGDPKPEESLALESLLYALDKVNADPSVLPGVQLGVTVVDSCGNPAIATRKLVGLLGDFVSLESTGKPFAVLGPSNPDVAEEIANLVTGQSKLPMISYSALSPNLNEDPLVLATSAPYAEEVAAIIGILEEFDWKYVGVVHSMTPYGLANNQEFQMAAQVAGICLGAQHYLDDSTNFQEIINDFSSDHSLNVIVAFVNEEDARSLLYADHFQLSKRFVWVGTDSWDSPNLVSGLENSAKGMLLVTKERPDLPEIQDYFADSDLLEAASARNPYLRDYLQDICPSSSNCQFGNQIQESLQELSGEISPLVNALYVAAHGANLLHDSKCGFSNDELCESFLDSSPGERVGAIRRVTVESGAGGNPFSFDEHSGPATYSIKNYQYDGQNGQFLIVGRWQNDQLDLQSTGIKLYNPVAEEAQRGPSGCSCGPIVVAEGGDSVQVYMYVWKWIDYGIWSTVVLAVSGLCGVLALLIGILFLSKRHSYVVQSASFSLSVWLLFGIILMYLLNVAFMFEANPAICGIRRFGVSFVYCMVYAAMLVKSIRANRFARKQPGVDMDFAGSWSQSLLFLAFLLPEVFLVVEWLVLIPPDAIGGPLDACGTISMSTCSITNIDLTIFMMYAYFLVLVTFLSSFGALDSSHAHHEGKSILVSSLFSILILIAWACVLNLLDPEFGIPAIPIGLTADATIILVFMFMGKVAALTKKEENADTGNNKVTDIDMEDRPEKKLHVYDNAGASPDAAAVGEEQTGL